MYEGSTLDRSHFVRYLGQLYFGSPWALPYGRYIDRAYRDFNRTLHGFASSPNRTECLQSSRQLLSDALRGAAGAASGWTEPDFDAWHSGVCTELIDAFQGVHLAYGQAQKWLNMTLKYLYTAHAAGILDEPLGGLEHCYPFAHMPVDNVVLEGLASHGGPAAPRPWSKLSADQYLRFQAALRETYVECPLDVEFMLWRGDGSMPTARQREA